MRIENYGIVLSRLTEKDIELVRNWRNDPRISQFMEYRDNITSDMQKKWFQRIDPKSDFFFVIEYESKKIGLTEIKNVNYEQKCGESGMFISEDKLLNSPVPFQVVFALMDFAFGELRLEYLTCHILKSNHRAIRFNRSLGFMLREFQEDVQNQEYVLSKSGYGNASQVLKQALIESVKAASRTVGRV